MSAASVLPDPGLPYGAVKATTPAIPDIIPTQEAPVEPREVPEAVIEQLAELWCEALLTNLRRHPIEPAVQRAS